MNKKNYKNIILKINSEKMDPNADDKLELSNGTIKLDIYQHLKLGLPNVDKNCKCENSLEKKYYCIPCKISCCENCYLSEHKSHLLIAKGNFELESNNIEKSFKSFDNILENDILYKNVENKKQELIEEINETYNKMLKMINDLKNQKLDEINNLFEELSTNLKNINDLENHSKIVLNDFSKKHKNFFDYNNKNKDQHNTIFLIYYDLLNISYSWSNHMSNEAKEIKNMLLDFEQKEKNKNANILKDIYDILFNKEYEDENAKGKIGYNFSPLNKLSMEIKQLNGDKLKEIEKKISKFNKGIESVKNYIMRSLNKHGNYKDIEKEINFFEHRKVKGVDNLFSQRKTESNKVEDNNELIYPEKQIKNKNDIILDNPLLNKYFTYIMMDIYDQYFRIPTIELRSSHADLKIRPSDFMEEDSNFAKVIEGTDKIMLFDKKTLTLTKKKINLQKNPHGYTKFPLGCRWILVGDKLYITGGKDEFTEYPISLIYERKTEKIKRIMDMQNPRSYHTMVFNQVFETMMVIGGENNPTVEIFDPLTNRWQVLPELNIPRAIPLFYFDEGRGNMYVFFGVEGNYLNSVYTDTIEVLDLTDVKNGWMKINYNNKARMDFKCHLNIYPLNDYLILIYGAIESRNSKRNASVYHLIKTEMNLIDKKIMEQLRNEAKHNKLLSSIVSSVTKASVSEKSD